MTQRPFPDVPAPIFVVQQHRVAHRGKLSFLHYDFRIELGTVLVSWALKEGPSASAREERRAKQTSDHALSYGGFEGVIPQGVKGAGTVLVWDYGRYTLHPLDHDISLRRGRIKVVLHGKKLRGAWTLVRKNGKADEWLLLKDDDEHASEEDVLTKHPKSALSGRTMEEVERDESGKTTAPDVGAAPVASQPGLRLTFADELPVAARSAAPRSKSRMGKKRGSVRPPA